MRTAKVRPFTLPPARFALAVGLALLAAWVAPTVSAHEDPVGDWEPSGNLPNVVASVAPEYPDSLVRAHVGGTVAVWLLVSETGSVADVRVKFGPARLVPLVTTAVRQWRFVPAVSDGKPQRVWVAQNFRFDPDAGVVDHQWVANAATDPNAYRVPKATDPVPVVRVPLVSPVDHIDPAGPPFLGTLKVLVDADGFVRDVRFDGPNPPLAERILARARRWAWEPARTEDGLAHEAWVYVRVKSTPEALLVDRPDSTMGEILGVANYANVKIVDATGRGRQRDMNPLQLAHVLADWISEDKAYAGADPWKTHCPVRFDARIEFDGPGGVLRADFARACAWMQVTTKDRVLFVPYGPIRARIDEAFARLFPDSSATQAR